jgi:hypothetical protein
LYGELRVLLREVKDRELQKASETHPSTYFYYYISVFSSSMHDRLFFKEVYAMLDPSIV